MPQRSRSSFVGWAMRLPLVWLGLWVGSVIVVSVMQPPDVEAVVGKMLLWGWAGLWCLIFGLWYLQIRLGKPPSTKALYFRLALVPPSPKLVAAASGGYVREAYLAFCMVIVGLATVAVWFANEDVEHSLLLAITGFTILVGVPLMVWALRSGYRDMAALLAPLGLAVAQTPEFLVVPGALGGRTRIYMEGTQAYAGERHGRAVGIVQQPGLAVTSVLAPEGGMLRANPPPAPSTAEQMAALTGEPASSFANVGVRADAKGVQVERRGSGASRHFLIDLLLAEAVAGREGEPAHG